MNTARLFSFLSMALLFSCVGTTLKCMESMEGKELDKEIRRALASSKGIVGGKVAVVLSLKRDEESDEAVDSALAEELDRELDKHSKRITKRQNGNGQTDVRERKENKQKKKQRISRKKRRWWCFCK